MGGLFQSGQAVSVSGHKTALPPRLKITPESKKSLFNIASGAVLGRSTTPAFRHNPPERNMICSIC
ncbi:hypothetical protein EGT74_09960 [Chitinophaga lutea]|uniref:Uncharacterized protein n=1 Tax=Chitinophaga lutea TaxID=2488634 RepID=A0A3N4Q2L4_9BACT|nr:hypothetical protein EGT74_09960 [Chitinophaga lutea]